MSLFFSQLSFFIIFFASVASAYTLTTTPTGQNIRWRYGQKLFLAGNPTGQDNFDETLFRNAVVNGLQQWKWASQSQFDFEYWQGTDPIQYPGGLEQNGLSNIFFASNSGETTDPNIIGFTQVTFNNNTGDLTEAHVMLNDMDFELTSVISDTSSEPVGFRARPKVFLNNIVTHELGHALGLSHSGNINSTMLFVEFPEQAKIACDDWAAVRHLYPTAGSGTGALTGTILNLNGAPVAGALVMAISKSRGIPIASVLTDQSGTYLFGALEAGLSALVVQPYQGSASSIPTALQASAVSVCNGSTYPTNFVTEADGHALKEFLVSADGTTQAGSYSLNCVGVNNSAGFFSSTLAPDMLIDSLANGSSTTYEFLVDGTFTLSGIGYLLMSPVKVSLSATDSSGNAIPLSMASPLYQSSSGFSIPDTQVSGTAHGTITVKATASTLSSRSYPNAISPGSLPFFALILNPSTNPTLASDLPNNARCAGPDTFAAYQSPPGDPVRFTSTSSARSGIGFCGNQNAEADSLHGQPKSIPVHPAFGSVLGWIFPYLALFSIQLYSKQRRARLNGA